MNNSAELINIDNDPELAVNFASKVYNSGHIFIYPTDTIYGFGCNPFNSNSLKKLDAIKNRVSKKGYILLIDSLEMLFKYAVMPDEKQIELLNRIWPNPVSIILKLNDTSKKKLNISSAAFRIPDNKFCISLLKKINTPLVSTSVNITGEKQLNNFMEIKREFAEKVSAIFYTKTETNDEPSTLIDLTKSKPVILRKGKIKFIEL
jgi:L-threonylcarbamoyladenylate synthase